MTDPAGHAEIALTDEQKMRLLAGCVPAIGFLVLVGTYLISAVSGAVPYPSALLWVFIIVILVAVGLLALQRIRDLLAGVALVEDDVLVSSWHTTGNTNDIYGKFQRLGILKFGPKVRVSNNSGGFYRITHSPASKIVWRLDRLD